MLVLGIESSCDETALALLQDGQHVMAECVASQEQQHQKYGGIVPELAARIHTEQIGALYESLIAKAQISPTLIDVIAVTQGPGLLGSLLVGTEFSKGLSLGLQKPLIPVDHVLSHFHGIFVHMPTPIFPALGWVISGGHTHLFHLESPLSFRLVTQTIDDACGECFDKVAQILGLPYPGGPAIEALAQGGDHQRFAMPTMMRKKTRLELSYSGLKTYMLRLVKTLPSPSPDCDQHSDTFKDLAASFQREAFAQIMRKQNIAISTLPCRAVYVSGGVACNGVLREMMQDFTSTSKISVFFPPPHLCTDNAVMIASMGYHKAQALKNTHGSLQALNSYAWQPYSRSPLPWQEIASTGPTTISPSPSPQNAKPPHIPGND